MADWTPAGPPTRIKGLTPVGSPIPIPMTPEQRYEGLVKRLPRPLQYVTPGTMGEAGFMAGAAAAPFTGGATILPLVAAIVGGALEDPKDLSSAASGAGIEAIKALAMEGGGKIAGKGAELLGRWLDKPGILERTAERIGSAIPQVFAEYPLKVPRTASELRTQLGGGKAAEAVGGRLNAFRDALEQRFGQYTPVQAPQLMNATSGVPFHYTQGTPALGQAFRIFDIDEKGNVTSRLAGIREAIDHSRELFASARTAGGMQKTTASAPKILDVANLNRRALKGQLNQVQKGLGDKYEGYMSDYAMAKRLEKVFAGSERTAQIKGELVGVVDQPKLLGKASTEEARLNQIRSGAGETIHKAVSPTGAQAKPEVPLLARAHAGEAGIKGIIHIPKPYQPETRELLPWMSRVLSDPRLTPLMASLGLTGLEDISGTN